MVQCCLSICPLLARTLDSETQSEMTRQFCTTTGAEPSRSGVGVLWLAEPDSTVPLSILTGTAACTDVLDIGVADMLGEHPFTSHSDTPVRGCM
jgi:hypothetical protein